MVSWLIEALLRLVSIVLILEPKGITCDPALDIGFPGGQTGPKRAYFLYKLYYLHEEQH